MQLSKFFLLSRVFVPSYLSHKAIIKVIQHSNSILVDTTQIKATRLSNARLWAAAEQLTLAVQAECLVDRIMHCFLKMLYA